MAPLGIPGSAWIEPVSTAVTAAQLTREAVRSSTLIRRYAKRLLYLVRHGKAVIPIFGAGGVGKTTVAKLLIGTDPLSIAAPYRESADVEVRPLKGDVPGQILVAPGQIARIPAHWPGLFKRLARGDSFGLINVVSYGFHSLLLHSYREHDVYQAGMDAAGFAQAYSQARRLVELEALRVLIEGMSAVDQPMWMVTLITKQDLWWNRRIEVHDHYVSGEYGGAINQLTAAIGQRNFQHEFLPVSLTLSSLASQDGEVFAPTTEGYDLPAHQRYLLSMFERINGFLDKGRRPR